MRGFAKLLFGDGAATGILSELLGSDGDGCGDADGYGLAERARRSGEWCGTTPGRGRPGDQVADALRGGCRPRGPRPTITIRF
jgi:hypothetical protein